MKIKKAIMVFLTCIINFYNFGQSSLDSLEVDKYNALVGQNFKKCKKLIEKENQISSCHLFTVRPLLFNAVEFKTQNLVFRIYLKDEFSMRKMKSDDCNNKKIISSKVRGIIIIDSINNEIIFEQWRKNKH